MAKRIVIATGNQGKVREMINAFQDLDVELVSLKELPEKYPEPVEDGDSFRANSLLKARYYCQKTGMACLADDSGLEAEALQGAPGVYSARYAGETATDEENNRRLIDELHKLGLDSSPAAYRCVLTFVDNDGTELVADGKCEGEIRLLPKGQNGFGYDPYFYIGERTMAEMSLAEKQAVSHRGEAIGKMADLLAAYLPK